MSPCRSSQVWTPSRHAFTLVELLVAIGVVALLIAILLPALSGSRERALRLKSAANLRAIQAEFDTYLSAHADAFPFVQDGRLYPGACAGLRHSTYQHSLTTQWPMLIYGERQPDAYNSVLLAPEAIRDDGRGNPDSCGFPPSYMLSRAFLARPEAWQDSTNTPETAALLRPVKRHDIRHSASKAMLWDWELPFLRRDLKLLGRDLDEPTPILFADGHVKEHTPTKAATPVRNRLWGEDPRHLHDTPHGARGVDYN